MKLMIASDIHGSAYYCEKMIERFQEEQADRLLLLGDFLYHGPRNDLPEGYDPKKVIEMLNPLKDRITAVRGNCDAEVDQMVLDFPIMADYVMLEIDGVQIYATHGHIFNKDNPIKGAGPIVLYGHTHVPANEVVNDVRYINPGSVSIPKKDSTYSYMIYEDGTFSWKSIVDGVKYDSFSLK